VSIPAEMTVAKGKESFAPRKDIKKGTSWISLIAFNALFEVSLQMLKRGSAECRDVINLREAPQSGNDVFSEFVNNFLRVLWGLLRRCEVLR
jgi:hypothetical protein